MLISSKTLAQATGTSLQSISANVKKGILIREIDGTFCTDKNKNFLKEKGIKISVLKEIAKNEVKKVGGRKPVSSPSSGETETLAELQKKKIKLQSEKIKQDIDIRSNDFLPTEFVENNLFRYIEKLHSNIERGASVFIQESASNILYEGELTNSELEKFINKFLTLCHQTKQQIIKELKEYGK